MTFQGNDDAAMKPVSILLLAIFIAITAKADVRVQMSNGMGCWRNDVGEMYGCSGGSDNGDSGFNDVKTGARYDYSSPDQSSAVDSTSGQSINTWRSAPEVDEPVESVARPVPLDQIQYEATDDYSGTYSNQVRPRASSEVYFYYPRGTKTASGEDDSTTVISTVDMSYQLSQAASESPKSDGCEIKGVMTDDEIYACTSRSRRL